MHPVEKSCAQEPAAAARTVLTLIGFSAVIGQTILMRELIVVFSGNEMSLGIMLAAWLFWTAAGSGLANRFALGRSGPRRAVAALECLLVVSLPPTIWALRASKSIFQAVPGELVGPVPMFLVTMASLCLICVVSGALFVAAARMFEKECAVSARLAASSAYMIEAAGSALGGLLASIVLLRYLGAFQIVIIVAILNLSMAAVLLFRMSRKQIVALALSAGLSAVLLMTYATPLLDRSAQARLWRGFRVVGTHDSIYGNLTVTETGSIRSIYDNGVLLANAPDESAAEEAVHYALLEHPAPKKLLLIGGGVNGSMVQALEYPTIERIDYVELDPALIGMARQFFPAQSAVLASDPRVHTHYADGRYYLRTTGETFDVIILNVPDPQTAQLNRFDTAEFFRAARDRLAPGGLLALELRASEETIGPDLADFLRCIQRTLKEVFPYVVTIPGETIHFFAAAQPDVLTEILRLDCKAARTELKTKYVREYFIPFRMMPDRMAQVREQLQPLDSTPANRDFAPIAYYFNIVLWSAQFKSGYSNWFHAAARIPFVHVAGATMSVLLIVAAVLSFARPRESRARSAAACCVAATGFTSITLEILLLLAFQSIYGYIYHQLAILIAMNMAGIAFGSWLGIRRIRLQVTPPYRAIASTQFLLALSSLALMLAVTLLAKVSGIAATWLAAQCVFPALAALFGMLGGYQFPIASEIYLRGNRGRNKLGALYAIDLLGGCAGALAIGAYLIPVFGFWRTAWLTTAIDLIPALLATRITLASNELQA